MSEVTEETALCKKCGEEHRIDRYRDLHFYVCPIANRVLLVNDKDEVVRESRTYGIDEYGEF